MLASGGGAGCGAGHKIDVYAWSVAAVPYAREKAKTKSAPGQS